MKYCNNCGAQMEDNELFCGQCGAGWTDAFPATNRRKSKKKKGLKIALFSVLGVILAAAVVLLAVTGVFSNPFESAEEKFVSVQKNFVMTALKAVESVSDSAVKVDTDAQISFDSETETEADQYLNQIGAGLKIEDGLVNFDFSLGGTTLLTFSFDTSEEGFGVSCPELFEDYYVINVDDLQEICSVLGVDMDLSAIGGTRYSFSSSDVNDAAEKYLDIVLSIADSDNTEKRSETVELPGIGESVKCTVLICTPTADDYEEMLTELFTALLDDDDIKTFCDMYGAGMAFRGYSSDDIYEELTSELETDLANVDDIADSAEELGLRWEVAYEGNRIYSIRILDENDQGIGYESCGNTVSERSDAIVEYYGNSSAEVLAGNEYTLSGSRLTGSLKITDGNGGNYNVSYDISLKDKSGLSIPYGTIKVSADDVSVTLTTEENGSGSVSRLMLKAYDDTTLTVNIATTDKASTAQRPSGNAEHLNADNINDLASEIRSNIMSLIYALY